MAVFGIASENVNDEISNFQMGRYVSTNEALWRLLSFQIHERYPTVVHLAVHLENGQRVYFTEANAAQRAERPPSTTLTSFFAMCEADPFAATLMYVEMPKYYTWNQSTKKFQRRKQGTPVPDWPQVFSTDALGRMYTVHPRNDECFYLRLLLVNVRGPKSFAHLKTVNGHQCQTYREACQLLGLLENDSHWDLTLADSVVSSNAYQIRTLFAIIITTCFPSQPIQLWNKYKDAICEDILHRLRIQTNNPDIQITDEIYNEGLILIEDQCLTIANKLLIEVLAPSGINKCVALTPTTSSLLSAEPLVVVPRADAWEDGNRLENAILMLDLRDFHPQTIVIEDTPIFLGLIRDVFTAPNVPRKLDLEFEKQVRQVTIYLKLQPEDNLGLKVVKLVDLLEVRHSVFIIGVTVTGKSEMCKTLYRTCANLKFKPYINDIEPKAVTNDELLGVISPPPREWVDGLISYLIRDESKMSGDGFKLMLNDGDIDPINIRSSRSVFNYFIDPGLKQSFPWSDLDFVSSFELNPDIPLQQKLTLINTIETTRTRSFLDLLVGKKKEIMLVGATDIGKSVIIDKFKPLSNDLYAVANELVNFYTASELLQKILKKPLEKKARRNFAPPSGKTLINLIDDINIPESHTLNRQFMEYYHWYDRTKSYLKDVQNVIFASGMSPAAESFNLDSRLQSNLYVLALSQCMWHVTPEGIKELRNSVGKWTVSSFSNTLYQLNSTFVVVRQT
ncbi:hypothetical protein QTP88_024033 [Uroleucon formosanum]